MKEIRSKLMSESLELMKNVMQTAVVSKDIHNT